MLYSRDDVAPYRRIIRKDRPERKSIGNGDQGHHLIRGYPAGPPVIRPEHFGHTAPGLARDYGKEKSRRVERIEEEVDACKPGEDEEG